MQYSPDLPKYSFNLMQDEEKKSTTLTKSDSFYDINSVLNMEQK